MIFQLLLRENVYSKMWLKIISKIFQLIISIYTLKLDQITIYTYGKKLKFNKTQKKSLKPNKTQKTNGLSYLAILSKKKKKKYI